MSRKNDRQQEQYRHFSERIKRIGDDFFTYVRQEDQDWQLEWTKSDLRDCYTNEYKPPRGKELTVFQGGRVVYFKRAGTATGGSASTSPPTQSNPQDTSQDKTYPTPCDVCGIIVTSEVQEQQHIKGARHRANLSKLFIRKQANNLLENKHGVVIEIGEGNLSKNGQVTVSSKPGVLQTILLNVQSSNTPVTLTRVSLLSQDPRLTLKAAVGGLTKQKLIQPGQKYTTKLSCKSNDFGEVKALVAFAFQLQTNKVFHILRSVTFSVGGEDKEDLAPTAPYKRRAKVAVTPLPKNVLSGNPVQFSGSGELPQAVKMQQYGIPSNVSRDLNLPNAPNLLEELEEPLSAGNYSQKFQLLLYAEEHQMKVDIHQYDRKGVMLTRSKKYDGLLDLNVPGLAENRPSVLRGDHLFVMFADSSRPDKTYKGFVHHVELEVVSLCFHKDLMKLFIEKMKFDIQFTFSRFPIRSSHFSVDSNTLDMDRLKPVIFPEPKKMKKTDAEKLDAFAKKLFDRNLANNLEQVKSIYHILHGTSLPAPYLVFGPPGTGKTVTVVEAMKQVYHQSKKNIILACAPSNSAADLLAKRLVDKGPVARTHLLRMCALSRNYDSVDPALQEIRDDCLNYDRFNYVVFPSPTKIKEKRIIVVTMVTAGRLVLSGCFKDFFTHIFLDEAGHSIEPEALISVSGLLPKNGQLVLAGDPKQLGPVLRSPISKKHGLEISLLERLMTHSKAYQRHEGVFNDRMLSKLLCNYRSHPNILHLPSEMFYDGELKVCADQLMRECLSKVDVLPAKNFPVIFHGIDGKDEREANSPSFFNVAEAEQVWQYISYLLNLAGHKNVRARDIGVISPYRRQVQKIRQILGKKKRRNNRRDLGDIKVGSVEEFQGQERLVIIISTVRSTNAEYLKMDKDYKLGFLRNPKRFNVAITRAKALLICIGNPHMLSKDEHWNRFLEYCRDNGAYKGCPYSPEEVEQDIEELNAEMESLNISPETMTQEEATAVTDQEWRGDL
ncbi:putative helicase MOV-10 [Apostichopus japonicus]|uniref:RNA helicase n=1 Tax=Stichopus japonicus TaxID=307972 RepID=A0A2G8JWJ6_STIJA|nr:putative helicase MOV-10 [Apostichopus japonicus]